MNTRNKVIEPLPEEFASYEEAAEFWETHETTDYPDAFRTVAMDGELHQRHYEVEIEADLVQMLRTEAETTGRTVSQMVSQLLRQHLQPAHSAY